MITRTDNALGKKEKLSRLLYQEFCRTPELTIADIMEKLSINRQSAYNYIKRLEQEGYSFQVTTRHNRAYYALTNPQDTYLQYHKISPDVLRKFYITLPLHQRAMTFKELREQFCLKARHYGHTNPQTVSSMNTDKIILDIGKTSFDQLITELIQDNEIYRDPLTQKLHLNAQNFSPILRLNYDTLDDLFYRLSLIVPGYPYYRQLHSVYQKLAPFMDDSFDEVDHDYHITYGRKYTQLEHIRPLLSMIGRHPFQSNIIKITYRDKNALIHEEHIATGLLVYSLEKDTLYLIGKMFSSATNVAEQDYIINLSSVQNIVTTQHLNTHFQSAYFMQLYNEMFSVSTEPLTQIVVEFDDKFQIGARLRQLQAKRPQATITKQSDLLIYRDKIRGLNDLANYLRQFGKSCRVIEPVDLKDKMNASVVRTLKRYEELNNE